MVAQLTEYRLLVPQSFNDGRPVPSELREQLERLLLDLFDGFTRQRDLDGVWQANDGRVFLDRNDEYRFGAVELASVLAAAVEFGLRLKQEAMYLGLPQGRSLIVPVDDAPQAPTDVIELMHFSLPKEAVVNQLRLPSTRGSRGELLVRYAYFSDEVRSVLLALHDAPLPPTLTQTAGGMAIVGLTGTEIEAWTADASERERVQAFLDAKLKPYAL